MIVWVRIFPRRVMLATAMCFAVAAGAMVAGRAEAYSPDQQQMCSGDALRLCGSEIPDVDRITACMIRRRAQLSPGCKVFFRDTESEVTPVATRRPRAIRPHRIGKARKPHNDD
jgi:hypothetical protein